MSVEQNFFSYGQQFPAFAIDNEHTLIWWNKACETLTGVHEKEILHTRDYWKVFFETKKPLPLDALLAEQADFEKQFSSLHFSKDSCYGFYKIEKNLEDKSLLWITAGKTFDERQNISGAVMSFQTISLRHLYWNSPLLSELIMRFPVPVVITLNGDITLANTLFAKLLGYSSPGEILHKPVESFLQGSDRTVYEEIKKNQYQNIVSGNEYQWKINVNAGIRYLTEIPTLFRKDNDVVLVSTFIDKTEEIQKAKRLNEEKEKLLAANKNLLKQLREKDGFFVSNSAKMKNVMEKALRLAKSDINIMLLGETGTGKTLMAKIIHEAGARRDKPFIAVNCAAIPETLMESAFFGHVKGAFTNAHSAGQGFLEAAHEGTLFLDEVAELSPAMQAKLLHAVENKHFTPLGSTVQKACDIRIISATHRNLNQMLREKKLREDFFYRICVVDLYLPALRERKEDIPLLIDFFLNRFSGIDTPPSLEPQMLEQLVNEPWTGNIRELQNVILRFIATGELFETKPKQENSQKNIGADSAAFPVHSVRSALPVLPALTDEKLFDMEFCRAEAEKQCLARALQAAKGNKSHAAKLLHMNIRTFHRYCARYDI